MKILIVGYGSIGKRHVQNLLKIPNIDIIVCTSITKNLQKNKKCKFFIQVNLAKEQQKSGIMLNHLNEFYNYCTKELFLNVIGLMCLPPESSNSDKHFKMIKESAEQLNLKELSMGMSSDYEQAILNGSTYLRLGTIILGKRNLT